MIYTRVCKFYHSISSAPMSINFIFTPNLSHINSSLIKIYSKAIHYQDRTSISSQDNSNNRLNFYHLTKFAEKFILKEINYRETIHLIKNYHLHLLISTSIASTPLFMHCMHLLLHLQTIASFSLPLIFYALENYFNTRERSFLPSLTSQFFLTHFLMHLSLFIATSMKKACLKLITLIFFMLLKGTLPLIR